MNSIFKTTSITLGVAALLSTFVLVPATAQHGHAEHGDHDHASHDHSHGDEGEHSDHEDHDGHDEVHLTKSQLEGLGIRVAPLESGRANAVLERPATLAFDKDRVAKVGPRVEAKVIRVLADLGEQVEKGDRLAIMDSVALGQAKAEYLRLQARLNTAQARLEREETLRDQQVSSEAELIEAQADRQESRAEADAVKETLRLYGLSTSEIEAIGTSSADRLSTFVLKSPLRGTVQERDLSPGQTIGPSQTPIHIVDTSELWAMIDAYEQDIPLLEVGQDVTLDVRTRPGESFQAKIDWMSNSLSSDTRTLPVRAVLQNEDNGLRSGMYATARIVTSQGDAETALLPVDAVQEFRGNQVVFVPAEESGAFRPVQVQTGGESKNRIEITSGLEPGDRAVVAGAFDLKSALTAKTRSADHHH